MSVLPKPVFTVITRFLSCTKVQNNDFHVFFLPPMKAFHKLLSALPSFAMNGDKHALARAVTSIQYDSRQCSEDALFVAMRGVQADGHDFTPQAIERGARFIIAEREVEVPKSVALAVVPDARKALAVLAHTWFDEPSRKLKVFGVTGTNGKTTTTFMLKSLLEQVGETVGIIGTTGNYIGKDVIPSSFTTPEAPELCALFVEMRKRGATAIVMEVSSHALSLERVYGTTFAGAVFTNLTQDHLDFHGTMENYAAAKQRLFTMLPETAIIAANADDSWSEFMLAESLVPPPQRRLYGRSERADIRIQNIRLGFTQTEFSLLANGAEWHFSMSPIGGFNVENAAGCLALMSLLGVSWEKLTASMGNVQGAPGRMQRIPLGTSQGGSKVAIVDYAHTPDALEKALMSCRELRDSSNPEGRVICVFGCGGNRDRTKRPKMGNIAAELADLIIPTSDNPRNEDPLTILDDILAGIPKEKFSVTTVLADRREAIHHAVRSAQHGDIVLIAGKGHENYQIIGSERIHFDDVEVVQEALGA
jgi:UDP-N-acetylmuramoyl-L-alanyl-D-glutamate--2,6-diaminopimelate ligase